MTEPFIDEPVPLLEGWRIRVRETAFSRKGEWPVEVSCRATQEVGFFKDGTYRTSKSYLGTVEDAEVGSLGLLTEAESLCLSVLPNGLSPKRAVDALQDPFWQSVVDRVKARYVLSQ